MNRNLMLVSKHDSCCLFVINYMLYIINVCHTSQVFKATYQVVLERSAARQTHNPYL